jgi:hypothetical protein
MSILDQLLDDMNQMVRRMKKRGATPDTIRTRPMPKRTMDAFKKHAEKLGLKVIIES